MWGSHVRAGKLYNHELSITKLAPLKIAVKPHRSQTTSCMLLLRIVYDCRLLNHIDCPFLSEVALTLGSLCLGPLRQQFFNLARAYIRS